MLRWLQKGVFVGVFVGIDVGMLGLCVLPCATSTWNFVESIEYVKFLLTYREGEDSKITSNRQVRKLSARPTFLSFSTLHLRALVIYRVSQVYLTDNFFFAPTSQTGLNGLKETYQIGF